MNMPTAPRHVTLVGTTPLAKRLYALLEGQAGIVLHTTQTYDETNPQTDVVIEATGGLTPAHTVAMNALGRGIPCVTANALLLMVHGKLLHTASRGQHAGLYATAALGAAAPLLGWLKTMPLQSLCLSFPTAANAMLMRMETRGEDATTAEQGLSMEDNNLTDVSGKYTLTCTAALYGLVSGQWLAPQQATRMGVENLTPADVAATRKLGLRLCYAATLSQNAVHAGVHAVPVGSPLLQAMGRAVVIATTSAGEVTLTQDAATEESTAQTMLADVKQALSTPYRTPTYQPFAAIPNQPATYLCRVPYGERDSLLGQGFTIITETVEPTGMVAMVGTSSQRPTAEGCILPLIGTYTPSENKLRLVG